MASVDVNLSPTRFGAVVLRRGGDVDGDIRRRASRVADRARSLAPLGRTGRLKASIKVDQTRQSRGRFGFGYEVIADTPYALFVHEGTRPHLIEATGTNSLGGAREPVLSFFWEKRGVQFVGPRVNHPGAEAQPFLRNALPAAGGDS